MSSPAAPGLTASAGVIIRGYLVLMMMLVGANTRGLNSVMWQLLIGPRCWFLEAHLLKPAVLPMTPSYIYERGVRYETHHKLKLKLTSCFSSIG